MLIEKQRNRKSKFETCGPVALVVRYIKISPPSVISLLLSASRKVGDGRAAPNFVIIHGYKQ